MSNFLVPEKIIFLNEFLQSRIISTVCDSGQNFQKKLYWNKCWYFLFTWFCAAYLTVHIVTNENAKSSNCLMLWIIWKIYCIYVGRKAASLCSSGYGSGTSRMSRVRLRNTVQRETYFYINLQYGEGREADIKVNMCGIATWTPSYYNF
jgi:hypothetical protein